jgi:hypothetical protein
MSGQASIYCTPTVDSLWTVTIDASCSVASLQIAANALRLVVTDAGPAFTPPQT